MVAIRTSRLVLREVEEKDFDAIHGYASDPEVCRYTSFGPNSLEETRAFIGRSVDGTRKQPRSDYTFLACLPDGTVVGGCGIEGTAGEEKAGHIGYLFRRDCWGQGYATEVANALVQFGFEGLGLQRIWSTCHAANAASAHVMEKVGMRREASFCEAGKDGTSTHEGYRYGMSAAEYERPQRGSPSEQS